MSFGRNPHVAKAEAEELKAASARDTKAAQLAWREAGRQWERAAARETDPKRREDLTAKMEAARARADGREVEGDDAEVEAAHVAPPIPRELLN